MPTFDRQSRFTLTIPNAEPEFRVLAFTGDEAISTPFSFTVELVCERADLALDGPPDEPEWLQAPAPSRHREPIIVSNAHRYLLDNHYDVLLRFPHFALPAAWDLRPNETPYMHFERVSQMAKLWQGEGVL